MNYTSDSGIRSKLHEFIHYAELKQLAGKVAALQDEKMFRSLAVLSFFPAEGKTLFCAALAMAYAEMSRARVLIVDTTTLQNHKSLLLRDCFNGSTPLVDIKSMEELRTKSEAYEPVPSLDFEEENVLESVVVMDRTIQTQIKKESDVSLLKKATEDRSQQYGLILLDTAPLRSRNRSNVDPTVVARLADASVLVVSRKLLDSPNLNHSLKVLESLSMRLMGVISNEACTL